jgi:iron(III) transport system permease protein
MWGLRSSRTVVILAAGSAFVLVCVLPPFYMLSAIVGAPHPLATLETALLDSRQQRLLYTTILLGLLTSGLATLVGTILGVVLARVPLPFKAAWRLALTAPAVLPPYVIALAWIDIGGTRAFTLGGAIIVLTVAFYPLSMLATEVGFRRIDPRLEDAALLVTTPGRALRRISLPLALPSVLSTALVIFVMAISEFSVPGLLRVRVFTTEVFTAFASLYDFGRATVLSLPLLVVSSIVGGCAAIGLGNRLVTTRRPVRGAARDAFDGWRWAGVAAVGCAILAMLVVPLAALMTNALQSTSIMPVVLSSREAVVNSVVLALAGATVVTTLAAALGYARARATHKTGAALDVLWIVLFTVPSTVVGIGLIGVWNRPGPWAALYGTPVMLVLAYLARFVPVGALAIAATVRSVPESHEEAAAAAGAGWLRTMIRIVLPQIRVGLLAVWVVAFILALGEVGATILVAPPGETTLPIRVYTMTANAPPGHVAALALFQSIVVLCPLTLLGIVLARREGP